MPELRKWLGRLVAANRQKAGLTQDALTAASVISVETISRIKVGAMGARFTTIAKLLKALGGDPVECFTPDFARGRLRDWRPFPIATWRASPLCLRLR